MKLSYLQLVTAVVLFAFAGCTANPHATGPAKSVPSMPTSSQTPQPAPTVSTVKTPFPAGEYAVLVESAPDGAIVVVNGIPVGKAPQRILLPGTPRGFFRDQVSLKVRFIAMDAAHASQTVEELLTPLDKIPAGVKFTPAGATRVGR